MATLTVTNEQLRLIQEALDFYTRVGIGQMTIIKDHPTFTKVLRDKCKDENGKVDYSKVHQYEEMADIAFKQGRNWLICDHDLPIHASYGIHSPDVDKSCLEAYDMIQVIRHEFWKADTDRSSISVASDVMIWTKDGDKIKCEIDK